MNQGVYVEVLGCEECRRPSLRPTDPLRTADGIGSQAEAACQVREMPR